MSVEGWAFSPLPWLKMVGDQGRVISVDLQQKMLDVLKKRAANQRSQSHLAHRCEADRLGIDATVDFALAFAMVHEVADQGRLLKAKYHSCLKPDGKFFVAEPRLHVSEVAFDKW